VSSLFGIALFPFNNLELAGRECALFLASPNRNPSVRRIRPGVDGDLLAARRAHPARLLPLPLSSTACRKATIRSVSVVRNLEANQAIGHSQTPSAYAYYEQGLVSFLIKN